MIQLTSINQKLKDAIDYYLWEEVKELLKNGADIDICEGYALYSAFWTKNMEMVRYFVESKEIPRNASLEDFNSKILVTAINFKERFLEELTYLVEKGLNITRDDNSGIVSAAQRNNFSIFKLLHCHGCDIHAQEDSAFIFAVKNQNTLLLEYLLENGVDANRHKGLGLTNSIYCDNERMVEILLKYNASLDYAKSQSLGGRQEKVERYILQHKLLSELSEKNKVVNKNKV